MILGIPGRARQLGCCCLCSSWGSLAWKYYVERVESGVLRGDAVCWAHCVRGCRVVNLAFPNMRFVGLALVLGMVGRGLAHEGLRLRLLSA